MNEVLVANRQSKFRIDQNLARDIALLACESMQVARYNLSIAFLSPTAMAKANFQFLTHTGPTDVITFSLAEDGLEGELLICPEVARTQAEEFKTSHSSELSRYIIHGILHLLGYDDREPHLRKVMKAKENLLVKKVERSFNLHSLVRLNHG
jgi:probable rRNA maturation factor